MTTPDYAAELALAQQLAGYAIKEIETVEIAENLPDELCTTEAVERIHRLIPYFTATVSADVERNYRTKGQPR